MSLMMPRRGSQESSDWSSATQRSFSDANEVTGLIREAIPTSLATEIHVFNAGRKGFFGTRTKQGSSPDDTDSPAENQEESRRRTYKRKHRRCWNTSRTALHQDSGSDSAPLLSSASQTSAGPVMFPNSETSDLDESIAGCSSRYGSIGAASANSVATVLPRRLPPLVHDSPLVTSDPGSANSVLQFVQEKCYEVHNLELLMCEEKYQGADQQLIGVTELRGYERINLSSTLELGSNFHLDSKPKQSSLVTIFSIWNTILGSSLLTMPWGIYMAGLIPGLVMIMAMSALCLYTAYRLLKVHKYHGGDEKIEVPELCRIFLGPVADHVARIFSITVLLGANVAYWILMSNFLYHSVNFVYDNLSGTSEHPFKNGTHLPEVLCPKEDNFNFTSGIGASDRSYDSLGPSWDLYKTVPFILGVIIFPLLNFNTTTFFTKFNSLGTAAIVYLIGFVLAKSATWGINMPISTWNNSWKLQSTFPALTGMLAMSFFIHNIIITIMQSNRDQSKNGRDLTIAYSLVTITYFTVGGVFYVSFPLAKMCIEDNFLNNFQKWDPLTVGARIVLLFQLLTVYPLINYMLRIRLLSAISPFNINTSRIFGVLVNLVVVVICILFARFMPYIGTVIRYTGAISGMIYVFTLPSLLHLVMMCRKGEITMKSTVLHLIIPFIGAANLIGQLFVTSY